MAVNLIKIRTDPVTKDWFRSVGKQKDQYQGIWIVSPEEKVLAGGDFRYDDTRGALASLGAALKAFGPVEPRRVRRKEPLPFRGVGVQPNGNVDLALYRRFLHQGKGDGPALRDTLTLKKDEWAALAPPKPIAGTEWAISEAIARKMVRPLCLNTLGADMPGPEDAKVAQLTAKVEAVENGRARIRLAGTFEAVKTFKAEPKLSYRGTVTAKGIAVYDLRQKTLSSFLLVFQGRYQQGSQPEAQKSRPFGAVIEWQRVRVSP